MAEAAADGADVDAGGQELRGAEVAEVVELHAVETKLVAQAAEGKQGEVRRHGFDTSTSCENRDALAVTFAPHFAANSSQAARCAFGTAAVPHR